MFAMNAFLPGPTMVFPGAQFLEAEAALAAAATKITGPCPIEIVTATSTCADTNKLSNGSKNKRKRVQWEEEPETKDVKRRFVNLPHLPSSQLSKCEKVDLWMQKDDYEQTLTAALSDVVAAKTSALPPSGDNGINDKNLPIGSYYSEAMAQTYSLCCSPNAKSSIALENVALLSLLDSSYRGLESHTLPRAMRVDRKLRKAKTVSRVLELQSELRVAGNPDEDATECLRLVSEYFSEPSRKFARALGEIDGTFVHLEP